MNKQKAEELVRMLELFVEAVLVNKQSEHVEDALHLQLIRKDLVHTVMELM